LGVGRKPKTLPTVVGMDLSEAASVKWRGATRNGLFAEGGAGMETRSICQSRMVWGCCAARQRRRGWGWAAKAVTCEKAELRGEGGMVWIQG